MMIGEYDFQSTFKYGSIREAQVISSADSAFVRVGFPSLVQLVFILMLFLVSIIIANLKTGLIVKKIRELFKTAGIYKLEKMVSQIQSAEDAIASNKMAKLKKNSFQIVGKQACSRS